jgi:hypothetical protein
MPDIKVAPEGVTTFEVKAGENTLYFHAEEEVEYLGEILTGQQLYDRLSADVTIQTETKKETTDETLLLV